MFIPTIVPIADDEHICGWLEHLAKINNLPIDEFLEHYFGIIKARYSIDGHLRMVFGVSSVPEAYGSPGLKDILMDHSQIPCECLFMQPNESIIVISSFLNAGFAPGRYYLERRTSQTVRWCPRCVKEDTEKYGRPVMHVCHQHTLASACWKHGVKLTRSEEDTQTIKGSEKEVRIALFLRLLYECRAVGDVTDMGKILMSRETVERMMACSREGRMGGLLSDAGLGSLIQMFSIFLTAYPCYEGCEPGAVYAYSHFVHKKAVSEYFAGKADMSEDAAHSLRTMVEKRGGRIQDISCPLVTVICGECGKRYTSLIGAVMSDVMCPHCAARNTEEDIYSRMIGHMLAEKGFTKTGGTRGRREEIKHSCGYVTYRHLKGALLRETLSCPECDARGSRLTVEYITGTMNASTIVNLEKMIVMPGRKKKMKNGKTAEITAYREYDDIDVRLDDGRAFNGVSYNSYRMGTIGSTGNVRLERIGEKRMMNCGHPAEIVDYRDAYDIDVMFEDGTMRTNVYYKEFKNGRVRVNYKIKRLGERRMMSCGLTAEIIRYRSARDVDIQFENGCIRRHVSYHHFEKGHVQPEKRLIPSRTGERRMMNCGMEAEITAYRNNHDIDVRFSNGELRTGVSYSGFRKGGILPAPQRRGDRVGERRMMECGMEAEVIEYRRNSDMTVRFTDGSIRAGVSYYRFQRGKVSPKALPDKDTAGTAAGAGDEAEAGSKT